MCENYSKSMHDLNSQSSEKQDSLDPTSLPPDTAKGDATALNDCTVRVFQYANFGKELSSKFLVFFNAEGFSFPKWLHSCQPWRQHHLSHPVAFPGPVAML